MLITQHWVSDGEVGPTVILTNRTVSRTRVNDDCHTGIRLGSNGVLSTIQNNGGFSTVIGQWLVVGDPADYYVEHTINAGNLQTEPPSGWQQLNASRIYESIATVPDFPKSTTVYFEISSDALGSVIVATATMTFEAETFGGGA